MIRTVKFLGWEPEQANKLSAARLDELRAMRKVNMMQIWIGTIKLVSCTMLVCLLFLTDPDISVCIPLLIMLASYATFVSDTGLVGDCDTEASYRLLG